MSTKEKEEVKAVDACSSSSCSGDKAKEQAKVQAAKTKKEQADQVAEKKHGGCCG